MQARGRGALARAAAAAVRADVADGYRPSTGPGTAIVRPALPFPPTTGTRHAAR